MKPQSFRTDDPGMNQLPDWAWVLSTAVALAFVLGVAHVLAGLVRNATRVHKLKQRVAHLRLEHLAIRKAVDDGENPADLPKDPEGLAAYLRGELPLVEEIALTGAAGDAPLDPNADAAPAEAEQLAAA